jgi:hypothetical protein
MPPSTPASVRTCSRPLATVAAPLRRQLLSSVRHAGSAHRLARVRRRRWPCRRRLGRPARPSSPRMLPDPLCACSCAPVSALESPAPVAASHRPPLPPRGCVLAHRRAYLRVPATVSYRRCRRRRVGHAPSAALYCLRRRAGAPPPQQPSCPCHRASLEPWRSEPPTYGVVSHGGREGGGGQRGGGDALPTVAGRKDKGVQTRMELPLPQLEHRGLGDGSPAWVPCAPPGSAASGPHRASSSVLDGL